MSAVSRPADSLCHEGTGGRNLFANQGKSLLPAPALGTILTRNLLLLLHLNSQAPMCEAQSAQQTALCEYAETF